MTILSKRIRTHLCEMAQSATPITYNALALAMNLAPPKTIHQVTSALEILMEEDAAASRPFIAALVISRSGSRLPAAGFFVHAKNLGRFTGTTAGPEAREFHKTELASAIVFWANPVKT